MAAREDFVVRRADARLEGLHHRPPIGMDQTFGPAFAGWLEPARPAVKLMVGFAGRVRADGDAIPVAWFGGLDAKATRVELEGSAFAAVDIELTPLGAYRVLGRPLSDLGGDCVELADAFGPDGAVLAERVAAARDWEARFAAVEDVLLRRLEHGVAPTPAVERAWELLVASEGRIRIGALARELNVSRRHLCATFTRETGLGPKEAARMIRFCAVRRRAERHPGRWADIAASAGYADQSHLNREFRQFAGVAPTAYLALRASGSGRGEGLPFVQDEESTPA